jgi:hypothetical protein
MRMDPESAYFRIVTEPARSLVRIVRSSEPMPRDEEAVRRAFGALVEPLRKLAGYKALIDLRNGPPGRNDDEFERATQSAQKELVRSFSRVAILVRSAVGKLQVRRLARGRGSSNSSNVFLDEQEALRYLAEEPA